MYTVKASPTIVICLTAISLTFPATAAIFNVDDTADLVDTNLADGACLTATATCSLRAAVQQANALAGTHTINVPAGEYRLTLAGIGEDNAASGDLDITANVDIVGAGPDLTTIDGGGTDRVFHVLGMPPVVISGVTIRGGAASGSTSPNFLGGGLYLEAGTTLDLADCAVVSNSANSGAGIFAQSASDAAISDCSFHNNSALDLGFTNAQGSAILTAGTMDLDRVEVSGNTASPAAGAVMALNATSLAIRNSTISSNQDAGISVQNTELDLVNSTVVANSTNGLAFFSFSGAHPLTVRNSILADNGSFDCNPFTPPAAMDFIGEHNLDSDGSCPLDDVPPSVDFPSTDPMLGPLALHGGHTRTHVPLVGSPVIDAGNNDRCEIDDQRGAPRPLDSLGLGATCDIGSVEVLPCDGAFSANEVLPASIVSVSDTFEACYTITNGAAFSILNGGDATWVARDLLTLQNGFEIQTGGAFEARLDPAAGSPIVLP